LFLSATAVVCLPRMFQVLVVEVTSPKHLRVASWAFPLYLLLISLFVLPIAQSGQALLPPEANPDLYVLTVPLSQGQDTIAMIAFLGGFSAATSMVIVAAIALATMISNHIVLPIWLNLNQDKQQTSGDVRNMLLTSRRLSIALILGLGYLYFRVTGGSAALASIGLISFAGIAQVLPSLIGGLYWHGATRNGALAGIGIGLLIWAYTLFLPSFEGRFLVSQTTLEQGLFGIEALRPQALFGLTLEDPLVHSVFWSLLLNFAVFVGVSLATRPHLLERLQAPLFVDVFRQAPGQEVTLRRTASSEDLFTLAQRLLGPEQAHTMFATAAREQGKTTGLPDPTNALITQLE
ncbi:MAG: sodium:solute symporter, partial [Pseudomonadota bacterium]